MNFYNEFRVKPGKKIDIRKISSSETYGWKNKKEIEEKLKAQAKRLLELQYDIYAENKQSLLIVLQAMDSAGKDGIINHVLYTMNPQGCRCQSFKTPTALESAHDFLWRIHNAAPRTGEVVIFNRSHYESVLVEKVHGWVKGKQLEKRYAYIKQFEELLSSSRITVIKFFLHISKEEQLKRFGERLADKNKHWKISENDYREREFWESYMDAFNDALNRCSTKHSPWFVIPSDDKDFRNLAVSEIILQTMDKMNPRLPEANIDIAQIKKLYYAETLPEKPIKEKRKK